VGWRRNSILHFAAAGGGRLAGGEQLDLDGPNSAAEARPFPLLLFGVPFGEIAVFGGQKRDSDCWEAANWPTGSQRPLFGPRGQRHSRARVLVPP
jgi:hypothetical protein